MGRFIVRAGRSLPQLVIVSLLATLAVPWSPVVLSASAVPVTACAADGGTAQNDLKILPSHGQVFYIDTGQGQEIDAAYAGYRIENVGDVARTNVWARVGDFTGGVVGLADPSTAAYRIGDIGAEATRASFFLLKANRPTTTDQTHVVTLYDRDPTLPNPVTLASCVFTFSEVKETIKAAANKVTEVAVTRVQELGGSVTVTVDGETGTIGSGTSSPDGEVIWFSPAARSSWPAGSLQLESTSVRFASNAQQLRNATPIENTLVFRNPTTTLGSRRLAYEATYVFRIRGPVSGNAQALPIAQISSGTQIKHTDIGSITSDADSSFTVATPVKVDVTKNASTSIGGSDGSYEFTYTLSIENTSSTAVALDRIVDEADADLTFKEASGRFEGALLAAEPVRSGGDYVFQGPFSIPAGATGTLTYVMTAACSAGSAFDYSNVAYGLVGSQVVGESSSSVSGVRVFGEDCGGGTAEVDDDADVAIDPAAVTQAVTGVTASGATLGGAVHPRGTAGLPIVFEYGTSPDLASPTTVTLDPSTNASDFVPVATTIGGLTEGTVYYYRVGIAAVRGEILSFTTAQAPADPTTTTDSVSAIVAGSGSDGTATLTGSFDANLVSGGAEPGFQWGLSGNSGADADCDSPTYGTTQVIQEDTDGNDVLDTDITLTGGFPTTLSLDIGSLESGKYYCARAVIQWGSGGPAFGSSLLFLVSGTRSITYLDNGSTGGAVPAVGSGSTGSTVTVAGNTGNLERAGWTFAGWNTASDGSGTTYAAGSGTLVLSDPVTLYAHWTANVTYDGNGSTSGSAPTDATDYTAADTITVASVGDLVKSSSSFGGWNTASDGSGEAYAPGATFSLPSSGAITLYAIWGTARTVTYDANGATSGTVPTAQAFVDGVAGTVAGNSGSLARTGFVFGGWNAQDDGSGLTYDEGASLVVGTDLTLFARWLVARIVTYDGNGNTSGSAPAPQSIGDGRTVTVRANSGTLARSGFTFDGWQTTPNGGNRYAAGSGTFAVSTDVTLYARWSSDSSGGSSGGQGGGGATPSDPDEPDGPASETTAPVTTRPPLRGPVRIPPGRVPAPTTDEAEAGQSDRGPAVRPTPPTPPTPPSPATPGGPAAPTNDSIDVGLDVGVGAEGGGRPGTAPVRPDAPLREVIEASRGSATRQLDELSGEALGGFAPGNGVRIEVIGSRTTARFVLSATERIDAVVLTDALRRSAPTQAADFAELTSVVPVERPTLPGAWSDEQREAADDLFAASRLASPVLVSELDVPADATWLRVELRASTYLPGSVAHLTVTSSPIVLASAVVARDGTVIVAGDMPVEVLPAGEHRIRLVGIRSIDGVGTDEQGEIVLPEDVLAEIERFDLGTDATVRVVGANVDGGTHTSVRIVPLDPTPPWWTLWIVALVGVLVGVLRRRGRLEGRNRRLGGLAANVASAVPAVVLGWIATTTEVVWWGIGLAALVAVLGWLIVPAERDDEEDDLDAALSASG